MATMKAHGAPWQAVSLLLLQIHLAAVLVCSLHPSAPGALTFTSSNHTAVTLPVRCLPDQASALLRLKMSFATTNYSAVAFRSWKPGTDCCGWDGIRCGESGAGSNHVTSLDLGGRGLESKAIDPVLFDLTSLEYLNLAYNDFNGSQLPSTGFERLTKLTYLNLSTSSFSGPVPTASIANLTNLASIDLSTDCQVVDLYSDGYLLFVHRSSPSVRLTEKSLENLIHNLSNLRELHLGFVDLSSSSGTGWCDALVVSCPQLQVLSLPHCRLSGPICGSLSGLRSLSVINLDYNHLSGPFPHSFTSLTNLSVLQLRYNDLQGWIPPAIFQHKKLVTIDVYANLEVSGYLPDFSRGSSLENLNVGRTNFSGIIPGSVSNLISLRKLGLGASGFSGELPTSIGNFKSLSELEISGMGVVGPMPSWVANLTSLTSLRFYECGLSGSIPSSLGDLRYLIELVLCDCGFSGEIPSHISNLTQLQVLLLYSNNFVGTVELTFLTNMPDLFALDLSENNLLVLDGEYNSSLASFPKLFHLDLRRCNLSKFPGFLRHQDEIDTLILSHNEIHGAIPYWAWETWTNLYSFELSNNKFTSIGYSSPFLPLQVEIFDLSNNMFEGCIPIPQGSATVLDYSNNMFSSVPSEFSSHLSDVSLFMASGNNFSGEIPLSFCDGLSIQLLDLSYNGFNGSVPSCLMENVDGLESLYFKENKLNGVFPDNIKKGCSFVALDFSGNRIEGKLPRSLLACKNLEVLDIGNNQISDTFPCWMSELNGLEVLVLKSNKLSGQVAQPLADGKSNCSFSSAIIIDLSSNNFSGPLPQGRWFQELKSMALTDANASLILQRILPNAGTAYAYKYSAAVTYKGHETTFAKILKTLVFIDLSNNAFHGNIPEAIGELHLLHGLNISHNSLTGPIPPQLGHLIQLEALDLSFNELSGEIPQEIASLDFLTTLNLSNNKLVGSIPQSPHFLTFTSSSFLGNDGLCGTPLSKRCINTTMTTSVVSHHSKKESVDVVLFLIAGLGFGAGFALAIVVAWAIPIRKRRSQEMQEALLAMYPKEIKFY